MKAPFKPCHLCLDSKTCAEQEECKVRGSISQVFTALLPAQIPGPGGSSFPPNDLVEKNSCAYVSVETWAWDKLCELVNLPEDTTAQYVVIKAIERLKIPDNVIDRHEELERVRTQLRLTTDALIKAEAVIASLNHPAKHNHEPS